MRLSEEYLVSRQPFRSRDLAELEQRVGAVGSVIQRMKRDGSKPVVLEIGFGFGTVLVQLSQLFGPGIELHGLNATPEDGDWEIVEWNAKQLGLTTTEEFSKLVRPTLHYRNVGQGLPFDDGSVDFVFSQTSFYLFGDKAHFIEEVSRVLKPQGEAKIDVAPIHRTDMHPSYATLFEIWRGGEEVSFWQYTQHFPDLNMRSRERGGHYLAIMGGSRIRLGLRFVCGVRLSEICKQWIGVKSIYRVGDDASTSSPLASS